MPRKKAAPRQEQQDFFPPIGDDIQTPDPMNPASGTPDFAAELKALKEQLGTVSEALKASSTREERLQNLVTQLATRPQPQQQQPTNQGTPTPALDWSKLPDPSKEPDAFKAKLAEALPQLVQQAAAAAVDTRVNPQLDAQRRQQRLDGLWQRFHAKYEDLAEYDDLTDAVAAKLVKAEIAKGLTPEQAVFGLDDGESFLDRVAGQLRERIKAIKGDDSEEGDEGEGDDTVTDAKGRNVPRTLGIEGAGPAPAMRPTSPNSRQGQSDLISEIKAEQTRLKIY